jgi:hypothetical protein
VNEPGARVAGVSVHPASFRDPSGFLFKRDGTLYRQVNSVYALHYDHLMSGGLYAHLIESGLLVDHKEVQEPLPDPTVGHRLIRPRVIQFVSYPYEWSFSQFRDAALTTLRIQRIAIEHGMVLKDASAYNIQFDMGRPVLIDSLSFETYVEGSPWVAYRQFCQHFLAPLALASLKDIRLSQLSRIHLDGIPLDLACTLLPRRAWLRWTLFANLLLHAKSQQRYAAKPGVEGRARLSRIALTALIDGLESGIKRLNWQPLGTEWGDYYGKTNYSSPGLEAKRALVGRALDRVAPGTVWDLGGNVGFFSRVASDRGIPTVCWDIDPAAVELNYREVRDRQEKYILPLLVDLTNPSPNQGWAHCERASMSNRGPADLVMALALIHHLAISNNVPLPLVAEHLATLGRWLLIEFVPKSDSQVQRLLASREDIFEQYSQEGFEAAFRDWFRIEWVQRIQDSERVLYLMERTTTG